MNFSYQNGNQMSDQDFQKLATTVATSIQKISQNVASMQRMVNQIGTAQDSPELRKQFHSLQHYTQQLAKDTKCYIKDLSTYTSPSQSEQRQRKMQRERLQDEYTTVLNKFQLIQRSTAQKEKEQINKVKEQNHSTAFLANPNQKKEQLIELEYSNYSNQQTQIQDEAELRDLLEQEQSVRQLENDIKDVNDIFKELGVLVHEQGERVDNIEANVERTESLVSRGAAQIKEASTFKNKIRRKKICLAVIGSAILLFIILLIYMSW